MNLLSLLQLSVILASTCDPDVQEISLQKSFYEAAQCSFINPVSLLRGLGNASLIWLAWLSLQGVMIDCKPHWHPEQTTAGCVCVCVCVQSLECILNTRLSLKCSTDSLNQSELGVMDLSEHTLTHTGGHTHSFWRPCRQCLAPAAHRGHINTHQTLRASDTEHHACMCHVLVKRHVLPFSMPCCHFG